MSTPKNRPCLSPWVALLIATLAGPAAVGAAEIVADGTTCSLANAIIAANTDTATGGCSAGSGADVIQLDADVTLSTAVTAAVEGGPAGLPAVSSVIEILARTGDLVERSAALGCAREEATAFRLFNVASGGDLTLGGLTLRNGCIAPTSTAVAASGGAILVQSGGALRLVDTTLDASAALAPVPVVGNPGAARGGAVAVLGGNLEISGGTFSDNRAIGHAARGGAVHVEGGVVGEITGATFSGNQAGPVADFSGSTAILAAGGGVSLQEAVTGILARSIWSGNTAGALAAGNGGPAFGGGLYVEEGRIAELRDSLFAANVARAGSFSLLAGTLGDGGGLWSSGQIDSLVRMTFADNQALGYGAGAGRGGGLGNLGRIGLIEAATFAANTARGGTGLMLTRGPGRGGGIDNRGRIELLVSSTLAGNLSASGAGLSPDGRGGGLCYEPLTADGALSVENTLVADNVADFGDDCFAMPGFVSNGFNLVEAPDASCSFTATGDVVGPDPQLGALADNGCSVALPDSSCLPTFALPVTSPAVDQGLCATTSSGIDARGALRPHDVVSVTNASGGDGCDMGAFERDGVLADVHLTTHAAESIDPAISGSGAGNLIYTVNLASTGSMAADNVAVDVDLTLPSGVSLGTVTPSTGSWDGSSWTLSSLASGDSATLTLALTVAASAVGGTDVIAVAAAVTATDGHDGPFTSDTEATSVLQPIFLDGFEIGDATGWSACVPEGPPC